MEITRCAEDIIFSALFILDFVYIYISIIEWIINMSVNRYMRGGVKHITTQLMMQRVMRNYCKNEEKPL